MRKSPSNVSKIVHPVKKAAAAAERLVSKGKKAAVEPKQRAVKTKQPAGRVRKSPRLQKKAVHFSDEVETDDQKQDSDYSADDPDANDVSLFSVLFSLC